MKFEEVVEIISSKETSKEVKYVAVVEYIEDNSPDDIINTGLMTFKEIMEAQKTVQEIKARELMNELKEIHLVISDYTKSYKYFKNNLSEKYYQYITEGFEYKWFREHPIHFRFEKEGIIHTMQFRHFVTNLVFWSGIVRIDSETLSEDHIVDCTQISTKLIRNFINEKMLLPYRKDIETSKLNTYIHDMVYDLSMISNDFNDILAISMNAEMFIDLAERYPRFKEIMRTQMPEDMQISDSEEMLDALAKEHMDIIRNDDQYNHLKPILRSSGSIRQGQYREFAVNRGPKPDISGVTMPIMSQTNYLVGGLNTVSSLFTEGLAGRKSPIMNKVKMGDTGHFSRLIMLNTSDIKLRQDLEECKTKHPTKYIVRTETHLQKLKGRYYRKFGQMKYSIITGNELDLIGSSILVRTPATCASTEGICHKCYGELFHINRKLNSPGALSATEVSEPVTQNVLSTKHLTATDSELITFNNKIFTELFSVYGNEIMLNKEKDDFEGYSMIIIKENLHTMDEFDEEVGITKFIPLFHLRLPSGTLIEMKEVNDKELFLSPKLTSDLKNLMKGRKKIVDEDLEKEIIVIPMDQIDTREGIFLVQINNNEKTKPLYEIMNLVDNKKKRAELGIGDNHELVIQMMLDLIIESHIPADAIHSEMIIRSLIRSKKDILKVPNFNRYDAIEDVKLMTIKSALNNHPSISVSLSFQYLSAQFESPLTFRKEATSFLDPLFTYKGNDMTEVIASYEDVNLDD